MGVFAAVNYHTNETSMKAHKHYLLRIVTNTDDNLCLDSVENAGLGGGGGAKRR